MSSKTEIASAFIQGAPPGELQDVVDDIQSLTSNTDSTLISKLKPAFQKYNEEQLTSTKLSSGSQVLISKHNRLPDGRYFDTESKTSFAFDHVTQKASSPQPYTHASSTHDLISSLTKSLSAYANEHYPAAAYGIYPTSSNSASDPTSSPESSSSSSASPSSIAILLVSSQYSPTNFWNGRWRSTYLYTPSASSSSSPTLTGTIHVTVHYYEDGNVSLTTHKPVTIALSSPPSSSTNSTAEEVIKKIAAAEKAYQLELNRAFVAMNEEGFKGLRRQLPVTRQKVEWEKVGGYRLGSDLRGGAQR